MKILLYNRLNPHQITGFAKFRAAIEADNLIGADVRKVGDNLFRAKLNRKDRLLFSLYRYNDECYCLVLEFLANHAYEKSRFLAGKTIVDDTLVPAEPLPTVEQVTAISYLNPASGQFNLLDKILSFDDAQQAIYQLPPPLVIIGSAGSGKTALVLEKMKQAVGDILYVSLSSFLVESARNLYFANNYQNEDQEIEFLSFREFLESIQVPEGREITQRDFEGWLQRHRPGRGINDSHKLFEEFRGVITGPDTEKPWLEREDYLALGVKQSIFAEEERPQVYDLFEKYQKHLQQEMLFDTNIISHHYQEKVSARYDFVVVDEVQDLTNIQLFLILKALRTASGFLLCGDSNQIVHPNFFSWSKVKTLFFQNRGIAGQSEVVRVLNANYRNSPLITQIANRILKLKQARFGSIDKESNYLVTAISAKHGALQLLPDDDKTKYDLDAKTRHSTQFAVLVMHPEQKQQARRWFNTPLVFSIQEAKGLEYDSIILFNFISDEDKAFREIARGIDPGELDKDSLDYRRVKDKKDRSLEVYKFYINALYVAITRAVHNLYVIEAKDAAALIKLLKLSDFGGELAVEQQKSSLQEWQKEARKLELQGKQEQADDIRSRILQQVPVPWPVLTREAFTTLFEKEQAGETNKKQRLQLLEYAQLYCHRPALKSLHVAGFKAVNQGEKKCLKQLYRNHYLKYDLKHFGAVLLETEKFGIDHRTVFNLTPLMVATRLGNTGLVKALLERGANSALLASNGFNALQISLEMALTDEHYSREKIAAIYPLLSPDSLSIQVDGRLIKVDNRLMGFFLINVMIALFYRYLGSSKFRGRGFNAKQLTDTLAMLPESILPKRRKQHQYISSILSGNEVFRESNYNRKLFRRLERGYYTINPNLKLRIGEAWVAVHDVYRLEDLGAEYIDMKHNYFDLNELAQNVINRFRQHVRDMIEET